MNHGQLATAERLACPFCGFDVTDLLLGHPQGIVGAVAAADRTGLPCCGDVPTNHEVKAWLRTIAQEANHA